VKDHKISEEQQEEEIVDDDHVGIHCVDGGTEKVGEL
jgi:hypothetical protein